MRVGLVCPYSFDVPGGVQFHVRDLAEHLIAHGHDVSVLAPADEDTAVPDYVVAAGRAVPVPYNGSVARLNFGPVTAARVRRWLGDADLDVLHIHEPITPSLALLALWAATGPIVATFHTANLRSRAMQAAYPVVRPSLEKVSARIAVSEDARRTLVEHLGGDAVVIPNGVFTRRFATARRDPRWVGTPEEPTLAFLGRLDETRKGLGVLAAALPRLRERHPGTRLLVAGRGDAGEARGLFTGGTDGVELLGPVSDEEKASLLASVDCYVAPHTGGESFGIVLVEAMAAGTCVVASDLGAFARVLDGGRAGALFTTGDAAALARVAGDLLADPRRREALAAAGAARAARYDWSVVAADVLAVYETVVIGAGRVREDPAPRRARPRWRS